jgi:uncharacterized protein
MIHVFYHSADLDGHASGAICKYAMPDAVLHGINYGDAFPWEIIKPVDTVYMVDFSLQPFSDMMRLDSVCDLVWIDHHKSAIEEYHAAYEDHPPNGDFTLDTNFAACELVWKHLSMFSIISGVDVSHLTGREIPLSVHYLGRYDIWKHEDVPGSLEFQYGMRLQNTWPTNQELWQSLFVNEGLTHDIREDGKLCLTYERVQNEKFASAYAFETELDGLRCIAVNKGFTNSLVFESVYDPAKHDAMLAFGYRGGKWTVSLYATKPEIDVSVICKARGGGGHKGAAGFQCETLPFLEQKD